jgi:hypothetical protein
MFLANAKVLRTWSHYIKVRHISYRMPQLLLRLVRCCFHLQSTSSPCWYITSDHAPPRAKCQLKQAGQASPTSSNAVQLAPRPRRPPRRPSPVRVRDQSGGRRVTGAAPGGRGRARVPVGRGLLGHAPLLRDRPSCEPLCAVKCEGCAYTRECTYKEKCAQQSNCAYACASIILLKHKQKSYGFASHINPLKLFIYFV